MRKKRLFGSKKIKDAYSTSIRGIKKHPYSSLGIIALGLGVISSAMIYYKNRD